MLSSSHGDEKPHTWFAKALEQLLTFTSETLNVTKKPSGRLIAKES
jgi:hypothetical protein